MMLNVWLTSLVGLTRDGTAVGSATRSNRPFNPRATLGPGAKVGTGLSISAAHARTFLDIEQVDQHLLVAEP